MLEKLTSEKGVYFGKAGFTLVELLFVIFILILSIGIALISFRDTKPLDEVEVATRHLAALVREAQNNSLAGKQQVEAGSLMNICLSGIEWDGNVADSMDFTLFSYKSASPNPCALANGRIDSRSENFVKVNLNPLPVSDSNISFSVPSGIVTSTGFPLINGAANSAQIRVTSTTNTSIYALVCVYSTGRVEEIFGQANCP